MAPLRSNTTNRMAMLRANTDYVARRARSNNTPQLKIQPSKKYLVVTCIDARIDPAAAFGIALGDAHVIRNAGGSCIAALRDIIISTKFLDVEEIFIIKHKDCGMALLHSFGQPILQQLYPKHLVCAGASSVADMQWHEFADPYAAVRRDWWFVQNHPGIRAHNPGPPNKNITIHGFVYDPATGELDDVQPRVDPSKNPIPGSQPNGDDGTDCGGGNCGGNDCSGGGCGGDTGAGGGAACDRSGGEQYAQTTHEHPRWQAAINQPRSRVDHREKSQKCWWGYEDEFKFRVNVEVEVCSSEEKG